MHHGLPCQTDETPDAREPYAAHLEACEDCGALAAARGEAIPPGIDGERPGEITWLIQAALAEDGAEARRRPALPSARAVPRKLPRQG